MGFAQVLLQMPLAFLKTSPVAKGRVLADLRVVVDVLCLGLWNGAVLLQDQLCYLHHSRIRALTVGAV